MTYYGTQEGCMTASQVHSDVLYVPCYHLGFTCSHGHATSESMRYMLAAPGPIEP